MLERIKNEKIGLKDWVSIITLCITIITVFGTLFIQGALYLFLMGRFGYWGIDTIYIRMIQESMTYSVFFYAAIAIIFVASNVHFYKVVMSEMSIQEKCKKFITSMLAIIIVAAGMIFVYTVRGFPIFEVIKAIPRMLTQDISIFVLLFLCGFCVFACMAMFGIGLALGTQHEKKKKIQLELEKIDKINMDFVLPLYFGRLAVSIAILILLICTMGGLTAHMQRSFKTIDNCRVVLCETSNTFLVAEYEEVIEENKVIIHATKQMEIEKIDTLTQQKHFNNVSIKD